MNPTGLVEAHLYCNDCCIEVDENSPPLGLVLFGPDGFFHPEDVPVSECDLHGPRKLRDCTLQMEKKQAQLL